MPTITDPNKITTNEFNDRWITSVLLSMPSATRKGTVNATLLRYDGEHLLATDAKRVVSQDLTKDRTTDTTLDTILKALTPLCQRLAGKPAVPAKDAVPAAPAVPAVAAVPAVPAHDGVAEIPAVPACAAIPARPEIPARAEIPAVVITAPLRDLNVNAANPAGKITANASFDDRTVMPLMIPDVTALVMKPDQEFANVYHLLLGWIAAKAECTIVQ